MTTLELSQTAKAVAEPDASHLCMYGPVEIVWCSDHLRMTVVGAGPTTLTDTYVEGDDLVVEVRPPRLEDLPEFVPGAD